MTVQERAKKGEFRIEFRVEIFIGPFLKPDPRIEDRQSEV
jgi:hypothetical protein